MTPRAAPGGSAVDVRPSGRRTAAMTVLPLTAAVFLLGSFPGGGAGPASTAARPPERRPDPRPSGPGALETGVAASDSNDPVFPNAAAPAPTDTLESVRRLLAEDRFEEALAGARLLVASDPGSAAASALMGDALYRRGDFEEAEEAYRAAATEDPNLAEAHFGVARILRTLGRYGDAAESFHRAAALAPENPKYLRILANHLARRQDVLTMLARYLELPPAEDEAIVRNVRAFMELLKSLGQEPLGEVTRSEPTDLPLNVLRGQAYLKADVNDLAGRRFAFDTGATGITVSPRLAKQAKMKPIRAFTITGMGEKGTVTGDLVVIKTLTLGGITIKNVAATVAEPAGPEEGLMGPSILGSFLISVDLDGGLLRLRPHGALPHSVTGETRPGSIRIPFRNVGGQIVVRSSLNGTPLNAMVDTGSSSSLAALSALPRVAGADLLPAEWTQGRSVGVGGNLPRKALRAATLGLAGEEFKADGMSCVDLSRFSRAVESEIYLVIGFPELARFTLDVDYRSNTLTFTPRARVTVPPPAPESPDRPEEPLLTRPSIRLGHRSGGATKPARALPGTLSASPDTRPGGAGWRPAPSSAPPGARPACGGSG